MTAKQRVKPAAKRVRLYEGRTNTAREHLRDVLREANAEGASLRQLAAETGLSFNRIRQIILGR